MLVPNASVAPSPRFIPLKQSRRRRVDVQRAIQFPIRTNVASSKLLERQGHHTALMIRVGRARHRLVEPTAPSPGDRVERILAEKPSVRIDAKSRAQQVPIRRCVDDLCSRNRGNRKHWPIWCGARAFVDQTGVVVDA